MSTGVGEPLRVELLGPILVWRDGTRLRVREPQLQGVLGVLSSRSNNVVSRGELIDALWGDRPPSTAENAVHVYVSRLRRILEPDRAGRAPARLLVWTGSGYLLRLEPGHLDVEIFGTHREHAHRARVAGDSDEALRRYDAALELWRGTPWCGVPGPFAETERARLIELRLMVTEDRAEAMLALGRHVELVPELTTLVAAHPLRERLRVLLMRALYREGRQAEALQVFRDTRGVLVDELGIEPGPELQQLHQRILAADATVTSPSPASPVPRQLPADIASFTGRAQHLADLHALVDGGLSPVVICAIDGTAGIGKTALAVHFGHEVADRFPDGQLYIDLRGYAPGRPMSSREALGRLLRGLGMAPQQVPADEDERAATYRSVLAGKRILVLLDNARSAQQVRLLLPGSPGCLVVITSRTMLGAVDGASHLHLDVLAEREALSLLARMAGTDRVAAEPESTATLVRLCVRLPLALRIAGARLAARPSWSVGTLVERLAGEKHRLDELRTADRAVRASFAVSHQALQASDDPIDQTAARLFRLLGVLDWVEMSVPVAAALLDLPQRQAHTALERLVDDHLLDSPAGGRYTSHDLLRLYARDLAHRDEPTRRTALLRALDCYLAAAEQATRLLDPMATHRIRAYPTRDRQAGFVLRTWADVTAWVDTEHANLLAAAHQAATTPDPAPALAVRLTDALYRPFRIRGYWPDLIGLRDLAANTAHRLGDKAGEALAREDLAEANRLVGRVNEAVAASKRALSVWRALGDRHGEQAALHILSNAYKVQQRLGEATTCLERGLAINRDIGYHHGEASTLNSLGLVHQRLGRHDDAIACHRQAIAISKGIGNRRLEAAALVNLGWAYHRAGRADQAIASYERSLAMARELGVRYQEAEVLWGLGQAHHILGDHDRARTYWLRSIAILHDIGGVTDDEADSLRQQPVPDTPAIIGRNI